MCQRIVVLPSGDGSSASSISSDRLRSLARRLEHRVVNPIVLWVLQSPIHWLVSHRLAVLAYEGRRSGRTYATPVLYRRVEGRILLLTPAEGTNWWKNFRGGHPLRIVVRGRRLAGTGRVETADDLVLETVRWAISPVRFASSLVPGRSIPSADRVRAMATDFVVVTVTCEDGERLECRDGSAP